MVTIYTDDRVIAGATAAAPKLRTRIIGVNDAYRVASAIVCIQLFDYTTDTFRTICTVDKSVRWNVALSQTMTRLVILRDEILEILNWKDKGEGNSSKFA